MLQYPHFLVVARPSEAGGSQDEDTGVFTPTTPDAIFVYDDRADVQDNPAGYKRNIPGRVDDNTPIYVGDAIAYLRDETKLRLIHLDDLASVMWENGDISDGVVSFITRLDGKIHLRWL